MNQAQVKQSQHKKELATIHNQLESIRRQDIGASDITMAQYVKTRWGLSMASFMEDLGVDLGIDTIQNLMTMPDPSYRYIIPEIIREAVRTGLRKAPIYPNVIAAEQTVSGLGLKMPQINMSDAAPKKVNEAETIPLGAVHYGSKDVTISKIGRGISISYEVRDYVAINVISIFLQDFGVKLGQSLDTQLIDCLINGEQTDGSASAPVIGIGVAGTLTYRDYLKIWMRMARLGRTPSVIIGGEDIAIDTLDLPEFKTPQFSGGTLAKLDLKTPVPSSAAFYVHSAVPSTQVIILDPSVSVIKLNAKPLLIESEKIISNQTLATYASVTTGFVTLYRDARVLMDTSLNFDAPGGANGFPAYMDPSSQEIQELTN
jgi:hypothetical protein